MITPVFCLTKTGTSASRF